MLNPVFYSRISLILKTEVFIVSYVNVDLSVRSLLSHGTSKFGVTKRIFLFIETECPVLGRENVG